MWSTKQNVDRHVTSLLQKQKTEVERKKVGYQIAEMYSKIKEYHTASRYLDSFLQVSPEYYRAHNLRGKIHEETNQPQKAINSYMKSLELEQEQKSILIKVCELYCAINVDPGKIQYWYERLEKIQPNHPILMKMKEKIFSSGSGSGDELVALYTAELKKRPHDVTAYRKLLDLYVSQGRVNEAYTQATKDAASHDAFQTSLEWFRCLVNICEEYRKKSGSPLTDPSFHMNHLWAQCQLLLLSMENSASDALQTLRDFDRAIEDAGKIVTSATAEWRVFYAEMQAQLYFLSGVMLLKRVKQREGSMSAAGGCREGSMLAATCFLVSYSVQEMNMKAAWCVQAREAERKMYERWYCMACYRASQSGHMLRILSRSQTPDWISTLQEDMCNDQGKRRLFKVLFDHPTLHGGPADNKTSYLYNNQQLSTFNPREPNLDDLQRLDRVASNYRPDNLNHVLWRALQYRGTPVPEYNEAVFKKLPFGSVKLTSAQPNTLSSLDVQAFLTAAVVDAQARTQTALSEPGVPDMLPVAITEPLALTEQSQWWSAVYQLLNNSNRQLQSDLQRTLQYGLEKVRLIGSHGLDANTLIQLARTAAQKLEDARTHQDTASTLSDIVEEQNALQARVEHYWSGAVNVLTKLRSNKPVSLPKPPLFSNRDSLLSGEEADKLLEEARYNLALVAIGGDDLERAIRELEGVSWPEGAYEQGRCYKLLADNAASGSFDNMDGDERTQQMALLERAKDCFKTVLDRLAGEHRNPIYGKALDELEEIQNLLDKYDYVESRDVSLYNDSLAGHVDSLPGSPARSVAALGRVSSGARLSLGRSFNMSTPRAARSHYGGGAENGASHGRLYPSQGPTPSSSSARLNTSVSTSRRHGVAQPSPERLDIQLTCLQRSQKEHVDELRKCRKNISKLEGTVEDLECAVPKPHEMQQLLEQNSKLVREVNDLKESVRMFDNRLTTAQDDMRAMHDSLRKLTERETDLMLAEKTLKNTVAEQEKSYNKKETEMKMLLDSQGKMLADLQGTVKSLLEAQAKRVEEEARVASARAAAAAAAATGGAMLQGAAVPQPTLMMPSPQMAAAATPQMIPSYTTARPATRGTVVHQGMYGNYPAYRVGEAYDAYGQAAAMGQYMGQYPATAVPQAAAPGATTTPAVGQYPGVQQAGQATQRVGKMTQQHVDDDEEANGFDDDDDYDDDETNPDGLYQAEQALTATAAQQWSGVSTNANLAYASPQRAGIAQQSPYVVASPVYAAQTYNPQQQSALPGPGFFSTVSSASAVNQDQARHQFGVPTQGVSPAAVSGADLYKAAPASSTQQPQQTQSIATSYPMTMPEGAVKSSPSGHLAPASANPKFFMSPIKSPEKQVSQDDSEADVTADDSYTGPDFTPLVTLPEIETKSGEEDEKALFNNRAKLYRFIEGQWKERGLGAMKILEHKETHVVRVLMRREQVLKVCANHLIKPDVEITFKDAEKKTMTWRAVDYTEDEPRMEQFCCKFKTPEIAKDFQVAFESAKKIAAANPSPVKKQPAKKPDSDKKAEVEQPKEDLKTEAPKPLFGATTSDTPVKPTGFTFGASSSSASNMLKAFASKASTDTEEAPKAEASLGGFTFSSTPVVQATETATKKEEEKAPSKEPEKQEEKPFSGFSFGSKPSFGGLSFTSPKATETKSGDSKSTAPTFGAGLTSGSLSFSSVAQTSSPAFGGKTDAAQPFAGYGQPVFKNKSPDKPVKKSGDDDDDQCEEYEPDVDFKPIVTLPEKVDLTTGEEDEEKIFGERAKLYRHDTETKQWKERGTGEMKIMKNAKSGTYRVLMRREQVHKTCANHYITKDMKLSPLQTSETSMCWFANDYAEEEMKAEQFAVRFKTKDLAVRFKQVFDDSIEKLSNAPNEDKPQPKPAAQPSVTLADQFKIKAGEWECESCYVRNKADSKRCLACETLKPGETDDKPSAQAAAAPIKFGAKGGLDLGGFGQVSSTTSSAKPAFGGFDTSKFQASSSTPSSTTDAPKNISGTLSDQFKMKAGDWECESCYVRNKSDSKRCLACETLKPGEVDDKPTNSPAAPIKFGAKGGLDLSGFSQVSSTTSTSQSAFGSFSSTPFQASSTTGGSTGGFKFGDTSSSNTKPVGFQPTGSAAVSSTTTAAPSLTTGMGGAFTFGGSSFMSPQKKEEKLTSSTTPTKQDQPDSTVKETKPAGFAFGNQSTGAFSFSGVTPTKNVERPKAPKTPTSPKDNGDFYVNQEGEDDHIYFTPIVKLPDNVEIKTGEEDEELLYCHRAKLYRFTQNEWKERGIGNVKLLRHKQTKKVRILMRREHVLKICMNHIITKDLKLNPMNNAKGKAWVWHCIDFSEDEEAHEQFAIRFATEDIANDFKNHFETARDNSTLMQVIPMVEDKSPEKKSKPRSDSYRKKSESDTHHAQKSEEKHDKSTTQSQLVSSSSPFTVKPAEEPAKEKPKSDAFSTFSFKSPELDKKTDTPKTSGFNFGSIGSSPFGAATTSVFGGSKPEEDGKQKGSGLLARLLSEPSKEANEPLNLSTDGASESDDVVIVREEKVPEDLIQRARKWRLPDAFYMYESRSPCKGCLGCQSETFDFGLIGKKGAAVPVASKTETAPKVEPAAPKIAEKSKVEPDSTTPSLNVFGQSSVAGMGGFAALAAKSGDGFAFGKKTESNSPFSFSGAGASVFGSKSPPKSRGDNNDDEVEESPDIHFEPIVSLPEVVDLKTGEEDDDKLFSHRAKLYRYDNSQWKERGVGEMKILRNKQTGRCRLLMRREQVLKVCCNHAVTPDMALAPLHASDNAWCWYAVDHTEGEPRNEQLAIKFKSKDVAAQFKETFDKCQQQSSADGEKEEQNQEDVHEDYEDPEGEEIYEEDEDYEDVEDQEEEVTIIFSKRATLAYIDDDGKATVAGMGDLQVVYDEDVFGARIQLRTDSDELVCNHIVCRRHRLKVNEKKKTCDWTAKDFSTDEPIRHNFRAQFSSSNACGEFKEAFDQGLLYATESEIDEVVDGASLTGELYTK